MNSNQIAAFKNLELAQQALKAGDKNTSRQLAAQAAQLAPELEEVWLLMAALASPHGSVTYLEKALKINPNSERAQKGMSWAQGRVQKEQDARAVEAKPQETPQPARVIQEEKPWADTVVPQQSATQPALIAKPEPDSVPGSGPIPAPVVVSAVQGSKAATRSRYSYITLLGVVVCLVLAWAGWQGATPVAAFFNSGAFAAEDHGPALGSAEIAKSDAPRLVLASTPVPTTTVLESPANGISAGLSTLTPTRSPFETDVPTETSPAPTQTLSVPTMTAPAPTETFIPPTATVVVPTTTPVPTATPIPTDIIQATATLAPVSLEQPSPTALPTDTAEPGSTQYVPPTPNPNGGGSNAAGRWIDVDLTNQRVYAYEGNTVVNSFIVSTGTWQHPTVTGQYHVYVKYRYTDMSGPGYYLPNVPYTMYFYQGYAIHGTYWHNNFGTPMSHGCVNLSIPDSGWVFNWASVGTLVNVHY